MALQRTSGTWFCNVVKEEGPYQEVSFFHIWEKYWIKVEILSCYLKLLNFSGITYDGSWDQTDKSLQKG